ncbi:MAG: L,D-transpeptidase family protein [Pseudomonadota bacterium]
MTAFSPPVALAQQVVAPAPPSALFPTTPAAAGIASFYQRWNNPVWFRAGADSPAVNQLIAILDRAQFDGLAEGPQLATQVRAAQAQARSGNPNDIATADRMLSTAWVAYVQRMKQATPGMTYIFPYLAPQGVRSDQILLTAAAAPSLEAYLTAASNPNYLYSQLRDTAMAQALAKGATAPDPRVIANLDRLRSIPANGRFMVVDSGNQKLTLFENGKPYDSMKVVAGKTEYPTPMIASIMYYMVYNPYWNAPDHLVRKIAQNYLTMGNSYLKGRGYQVMKDWTSASEVLPSEQVDWKAVAAGKVKIRIRQKPSDDNSMGDLKFPFPNGLDIFLHDTPHKEYFAKSDRMLSNGCVRLEDARRLGRWLLGTEPASPGDGAEIQVKLPQGVPIFLTYITVQAKDGQLSYLPDPYGWDRVSPGSIKAGQ